MKKFLVIIFTGGLLIAFHVKEDEKIKEDITLIGESLIIEGKVDGDVAVINGNLELHGEIEGDVAVIGGNANLYSGSKLEGSIAVIGGKLNKEKGAEIKGEISQISLGPLNILLKLIPPKGKVPAEIERENDKIKLKMKVEEKDKVKENKFLKSLLFFIWGISLSFIILIISLVFPQIIENMENFIEKKMGYSFLAGFLAEILFVPACLILLVSIIGIPLIPLFIIAFILSLLLSLAPSSLFIGKIIQRNLEFLPQKTFLLSFIGLLLLFITLSLGSLLKIGNGIMGVFGNIIILTTIFILYLYFTFGLGSIILSRFGTKKFSDGIK